MTANTNKPIIPMDRKLPVFRFYDETNRVYINEANCNDGKDSFWEYIDGLDGRLEQSFDDGITFRTLEEVNQALEFKDKIDKGIDNGSINIIGGMDEK